MKTTGTLTVGTIVTWTSQAAGTTTTKTGEVLGFIPAYANAYRLYPLLNSISSSQDKLGSITTLGDRYLIRVDRANKAGQPSQPWYYAPRHVKNLTKVIQP